MWGSFGNTEPAVHIDLEKTSCGQKLHVSNECMFCVKTTSDTDNRLKRSQGSKQVNKHNPLATQVSAQALFIEHRFTTTVIPCHFVCRVGLNATLGACRYGKRNLVEPRRVMLYLFVIHCLSTSNQ